MQRTSQLWQLPGIAYRSTFRTRQFHSRRFDAHQSNQSRSWKTFVRLGFALVGAGALGYDGYVNDFTYSGSSVRFVRSVKTAVLIAIDYLGLDENDAEYKTKIKVLHQKSADRLLETCLLNGGLYIKVGQGFAAINHILPIEYTSTLAKLQDQCLPTSKEDIQKVFRTDFGQLPEELYQEFDYKPIAAASLAQVFKARLHSGEQVAVKVQYSDLQKRFISDVATIIFLQDIIELVFKNYNFGWIMNDLRKNLVQELNFVQEGHNAERCANDLKKLSYVAVPKIYWPHTKTRVLTMEWMDGYKIGDVDAIKQQNLSLIDVGSKLYNVFAEQIFHTGFVHADPHPGNIFVRRNAHNGRAEIVLLDHGLYEELPENVRGPLCEFWEATVLRDEAKMKVAANKIDVVEYIKFAEVLFQQPIRMRSGPIRSKLSQEELDHIRKVARENFDVIMSTLKEMPRSMLFVIRNLNTVRSIGDKHGNVVNRPQVMARYAQRCLYQRNQRSPVQYMRWMCRRIYFEYCLWSASMRLRVMNYYFNFLYLVGRAPESAKTLMHDLMEQDKQQLH